MTSSDQKDVQDYQHFLTQAKQMSKVMWTDVMEVDQAIDGFGGASDTFFHSADGMLRDLRKRLTEAVLGVVCVVAASRKSGLAIRSRRSNLIKSHAPER